jgi:hypothetical protein
MAGMTVARGAGLDPIILDQDWVKKQCPQIC